MGFVEDLHISTLSDHLFAGGVSRCPRPRRKARQRVESSEGFGWAEVAGHGPNPPLVDALFPMNGVCFVVDFPMIFHHG